jgi:hypothetical protein
MENKFKENNHEYIAFQQYVSKYYANDNLLVLWLEIDRYRQIDDKKQVRTSVIFF